MVEKYKVYCPECRAFCHINGILAKKVAKGELHCQKCGRPFIPVISAPAALTPDAEQLPDFAKENTPFIITTTVCPVCETRSHQRFVKSHEFHPQGHDLDLRPTAYVWTNPDFAKYHPPLYFMWHCPGCHFTAPRANFEAPAHNTQMKESALLGRISSLILDPPGIAAVTELLSSGVDLDDMDFFHALKLHLLAIFWLERIDEIRERDALDLARYYTRLAWLFRDLDDFPQAKAMTLLALDALAAEAAEAWPDMPRDERGALERAIHAYDVTYERSNVLEKNELEHKVVQTTARIHLKLGNLPKAKELLHLSLKLAYGISRQLDEQIKAFVPSKLFPEVNLKLLELQKQKKQLDQFFNDTRRLLESK